MTRCTSRTEATGRGTTNHDTMPDANQRKEFTMMGSDTDFDIRQEAEDGVFVVAVRGEIDVATAPQLREKLASVAGTGTHLCVVDLSATTFVDSTALGVLVGAAQACRDAGGDLRLVVTDPHISKVFSITGLDDVLSIYADAGQASARR